MFEHCNYLCVQLLLLLFLCGWEITKGKVCSFPSVVALIYCPDAMVCLLPLLFRAPPAPPPCCSVGSATLVHHLSLIYPSLALWLSIRIIPWSMMVMMMIEFEMN